MFGSFHESVWHKEPGVSPVPTANAPFVISLLARILAPRKRSIEGQPRVRGDQLRINAGHPLCSVCILMRHP